MLCESGHAFVVRQIGVGIALSERACKLARLVCCEWSRSALAKARHGHSISVTDSPPIALLPWRLRRDCQSHHSLIRERMRKRRRTMLCRTHCRAGQVDILTIDISTASRTRLLIQIWPPLLHLGKDSPCITQQTHIDLSSQSIQQTRPDNHQSLGESTHHQHPSQQHQPITTQPSQLDHFTSTTLDHPRQVHDELW